MCTKCIKCTTYKNTKCTKYKVYEKNEEKKEREKGKKRKRERENIQFGQQNSKCPLKRCKMYVQILLLLVRVVSSFQIITQKMYMPSANELQI